MNSAPKKMPPMIGGAAQKIATTQQRLVEKGGLFVSNLFMAIALLSMAVNFFLVLTLWQTAPLLQVISQIVFSDALSSRQLVVAEPFGPKMMDQNKLNEMFVRYYLTILYSSFGDSQEMLHRWSEGGLLHRMSSGQVYYGSFFKIFNERLSTIDKETITQSVQIKKLSQLDNTWTVDVDVYTFNVVTNQLTMESYNVVMETMNDSSFAFFDFDLVNPNGFRVIAFRQTGKKI